MSLKGRRLVMMQMNEMTAQLSFEKEHPLLTE
jgi:hypothetical protein